MQKLLTETAVYVVGSLTHNWLPLSLAIITAVLMKVYINPEKLKGLLLRKSSSTIPGSVAVGAFTPLCACGTMAVVIGMLTTALPWGPIMAFLTSSPLMSPDGFILVAGIISFKFAVALALASLIIGLGSGYLTDIIEKRTDYLKDQVQFAKSRQKSVSAPATACGCSGNPDVSPTLIQSFALDNSASNKMGQCCVKQVCCAELYINSDKTMYFEFMLLSIAEWLTDKTKEAFKKIKWHELGEAALNTGVKQILLYYSVFVAIGFLINHFVPSYVIAALFSSKNIFAVPLAALVGLPIYVNGESAIPLIKSLMAAGASGGAMLAFLITGPGTSAGVIAGIATIMKKRAITLYVLFLLFGGILLGYLYDLALMMGV